nr:transcription termination/antitermination NusG family protein [Roseomonas acroporae]
MAHARRPAPAAPPPPTDLEIIARTKPLTGAVPVPILRAQSEDAWGGPSGPRSVGTPGPSSDALWYCVKTHSKAEFRAVLEISRLGLRPYCPLVMQQRKLRQPGGKREPRDVIEPLFPRYLFVQFDRHRDRWRALFNLESVDWLMMGAGEVPISVPDRAIAYLRAQGRLGDGVWDDRTAAERHRSEARARQEAHGARVPVTYLPAVEPGQRVKITSGPFADLHGIARMATHRRITLLLDMFGAPQEVQVERSEVQAL